MISDDFRVAQVRLQRPVAEDVVGHLLRDADPVGGGHRRLVALQHYLQRLGHLLFKLPLVEVRVVQLRSEHVQQRLVHAPLHRAERVGVPDRAARGTAPFERRRARHPRLGEPVGEAHAVRFLPRDRPVSLRVRSRRAYQPLLRELGDRLADRVPGAVQRDRHALVDRDRHGPAGRYVSG